MNGNSTTLPRAWLTLGLLCVVACLNYADRMMLTTMRASIIQAIPMTEAQFGLLTSVFLWVYACLSPFTGFLADRFSRSRVIMVGLLVWSTVTWLTAHATSYRGLLITRALMGISEACYIPAALALIADYHRGNTRSFATGIHMVGISVGVSLGGLGGLIAERHHWTSAFRIFGGIGIIYSVVLAFTLRDGTRDTSDLDLPAVRSAPTFSAAFAHLFSTASFYLALAYWGLLSVAGWAIDGWLPTFMLERFHLSQGVAGMSATAYLQPAACIGMLLGGALADRLSNYSARGRMYVVALALGLAAPGLFVASHTTLYAVALAGFMGHAAAAGITSANMMPILCVVTDARYRATGYGLLNLFGCLAGGFAVFLGGILRDTHVGTAHIFEGTAVALICGATLLLFMRPRQARI